MRVSSTPAATVSPERRRLLAKIHIAAKQLAIADESYRALLMRVAGISSARDCSISQLESVLAEFKRLGFVTESKRPTSNKAYVRMIYGMWRDLKPYLNDHSQRALQSFASRQTGVDSPEFLTPEDANDVIEGLKAWLHREKTISKTAKPNVNNKNSRLGK